MQVIPTEIDGVKIVMPDVHRDGRGWFVEQYNAERYKSAGIVADFVQDNESFSSKGVIRGLHWQAGEHAQAKLVRVIRGAVWDVAVDIRKGSPTFGKHVSCVLFAADSEYAQSCGDGELPFTQFFVPRGFAHGFIVLEDNTLFSYKCDNLYCPEADRGMLFSDPALGISWPDIGCEIKLSEKDCRHPLLKDIEAFPVVTGY